MPSVWSAILAILACAGAANTSALTTRHFSGLARQILTTNSSSLCPAGLEPIPAAAASLSVSNNTLTLSKLSCEAIPTNTSTPSLASKDCVLLPGQWGWLDGILYWIFPSEDCDSTDKSVTKTSTKTTTATATRTNTVTSISVSLATSVSTATLTLTDVTTAVSVSVSSETETETETDVVTVTTTVSAPSPTESGTDVCGAICSTVCNDFGPLPPDTEDCQTLVDSITVLNGQISPTFTVDPNHVQTITFGTCRFWFENLGPDPLEYCWLSLVQIASAAASECLPPTQPVMSEGLCVARDSTWEVGVAHS